MRALLMLFLVSAISLSASGHKPEVKQGVSMLGAPLLAPTNVPSALKQKLAEAKTTYIAEPDNADAIIWYGRRMAYTGDYQEAIAIFSEGIEKHPTDARLYRHRGHRYISVREYDKAIADFTEAVRLIEGTPNAIEPDGMPNVKGIPVSSTHGNIWYHLGLAYYLKQDFDKALWAYEQALATSNSADNVVSTTHWLYMILLRLGREKDARDILNDISPNMPVIENFAYHQLCLFYKGDWSLEKLVAENGGGPQGAGMAYGIANWHRYNGDRQTARKLLQEIIAKSDDWPAFGYIAAEADLAALRK